MLDNVMLKSCCQKMVTPAVKREAGDINCLRTVAKRRGDPHLCLLASRCLHRFCKNRKALEALSRQIVSLFSPDCHGKTTKSAFLLPNGVGVSDPECLVC